MLHITTKEEFKKEVLEAKGKVLVDFFAIWCGPCKLMEPVLENLEKTNPEIKIVKVNVDEAQELAGQYEVMSIPTLITFKDGRADKQMVGAQNPQTLVNAFGGK